MAEKRRDSAGRLASALSLPDWSVRRKLALALTIPMLLAAVFGGLRVHSALSESDSYSATASQVTVLAPAVAYLAAAETAIITSRAKPALDDPDRVSAIGAVDAAGTQLERTATSAELTSAQQKQLDTVLSLSVQLRDDQGYVSVGQAVSQVRQLQRGVSELIDAIVAEQIEPEPRLQMLQQTIDGRVSLAMQQFQGANNGKDVNSVDLAAEVGVEAAILDRLGAQLGTTEKHVLALSQQNAAHLGGVKLGGHDVGGPEAFAQYDALSTDLLGDIDEQLSAAAGDARTQAIANAVVTAAALLAAVLLALFISRLLLNPIRRVREGALDVANNQLPEMVARIRAGEEPGEIVTIPVTTHEEMGQLARAVDDLHRQAVHLASGEASLRTKVAEMFSTLSRRNTSLINQQLGLIERLEKDEEDPQRLESLFRLDHLASRMRRTADSLMVLADAPTQTSDTDALGLDDVFQAAMAGVQEYQRVQVESSSSEQVNGAAAADVVHLMTELVDNALAFSPPTAPVRISTRQDGERTVVEISDGGLGIAPDVLVNLNDDLSSGGEVTPETARRMGLLVVSRLAKRHGVTVALTRNQRGGTTATVLLPAELLRSRPAPARPPAPSVAPSPAPLAGPAAPALSLAERLTQERIKRGVPEPVDPAEPAPVEPPPGRPAAVEPAEAGAPASGSGDAIEAAINAVIRLPQREPGATRSSGSVPGAPTGPTGGSLFQRLKGPEPETAASPATGAHAAAPPVERPVDLPAEHPVPAPAEPAVAAEQPAESWMAQASSPSAPAAPPAAPTVYDSLDARSPVPETSGSDETPIFREMRSNWFNASAGEGTWTTSEIEAGWEAAEQVAEAPALQLSESGLPMRRPGKRLVPGGVTPAVATVTRDPEAIRARLAAHAAGVSRGRTAAVDDPAAPAIEEGPA
jgi:signal transduction histidine kinase